MKYQRKPEYVDAFKWEGHLHEMPEWIRHNSEVKPDGRLVFWKEKSAFIVELGEWIYRDCVADFVTSSSEEYFKRSFVPVHEKKGLFR